MEKSSFLMLGLGILAAALTYWYLSGWYSIIPWIAIVLVIGLINKYRIRATNQGALFGFALFLTYLIMGYEGKRDFLSLFKFAGLALLLSLLGAICGIIGTYIGYYLKKLIWNR